MKIPGVWPEGSEGALPGVIIRGLTAGVYWGARRYFFIRDFFVSKWPDCGLIAGFLPWIRPPERPHSDGTLTIGGWGQPSLDDGSPGAQRPEG